MNHSEPSEDLAAVQRWLATGGEVRVRAWGPPVLVSLVTCDGAQEMHRIVSSEFDLIAALTDGSVAYEA